MFNTMGDLLRQQSKKWSIRRDPRSGAWWVLDLWHESLAGLSPESEVPEDSPALTIIPADAFGALIAEADRLGVLTRIVGPKRPESVEEVPTPGGEKTFLGYKLRNKALDLVRDIVATQSADDLTRLD